MVRFLLYVSTSQIAFPDNKFQIESIVEVARSRNRTLDVTGALIATDTAFAQALEGPPAAIDELMASIRRDIRHKDVRVVVDQEIDGRRFPGWSMAYSGRATYVARLVEPLNAASGETDAAHWVRLIQFMQEFAIG